MIRYTTPTITLVAKGITLENTVRIWASVEQHDGCGNVEIEVEVPQASAEVIGGSVYVPVTLTQEQTGRLHKGFAQVQLNWITSDGVRKATNIGSLQVMDNLMDKVVSYE